MAALTFTGKVAVVTGAGAGLGKTYALLLASRGAKVVVNDLGGGRHGDGSSSRVADEVVKEIKQNGGIAVADYNSVVEGEKIIKTALDNFGRVDILINNAGILRDSSLVKITDQDWDLVHLVHLKGSFKTTQAAFSIMKKQGFGRIVMTTSVSGLYGNFGQANYSAAKSGLIGLAKTVAIEGQKYNIHCNVIAPTAGSRLTEDILPPDVFAQLNPELIAPVVAYLCHEICTENGAVIESAGGWAGKITIVRSNGSFLRSSINEKVTLDNVHENWSKITDMTNPLYFGSIQEATGAVMESLETLSQRGNSNSEQEDSKSDVFKFNDKDIILYALSVGTSLKDAGNLKFLYESHEQFSALPTFYILPALQHVMSSGSSINTVPGKTIDFSNVLHGEQYIEIVDTLPSGTLTSKQNVVEVLDKGSGAVIVNNVDSYDQDGKLVVKNQIVAFAVGAGNFGGNRTGNKIVPCINKPNKKPEISVTQKTTIDQAALYRLTGDRNPLHIDPDMAKAFGFQQPILHGLCSLGISVRIVLQTYADNDVSLFKACKARFAKPVIPGQSLKVNMWRDQNRILFETIVVETNTPVITGAYVELKTVKMPTKGSNSSSLKSDAIFEFIIEKVKGDPQKAKSIGGVFLYKITKDGKEVKKWTMDLKNAKVYEGTPESKPNTTLTVSDEDFLLLAEGKLKPQQAFMKGKLKVAGNLMLAQKLAPLLSANTAKL